MFESKAGVLLVGGLGFFVFAFISNALVPDLHVSRICRSSTVSELTNPNLMYEFEDLARRFPEQFKKYYGEPTREAAAEALNFGARNLCERRLLALPQSIRPAGFQ